MSQRRGNQWKYCYLKIKKYKSKNSYWYVERCLASKIMSDPLFYWCFVLLHRTSICNVIHLSLTISVSMNSHGCTLSNFLMPSVAMEVRTTSQYLHCCTSILQFLQRRLYFRQLHLSYKSFLQADTYQINESSRNKYVSQLFPGFVLPCDLPRRDSESYRW